MTLKFHWFLPTNGGDGRHVVSGGHGVDAARGGRPASTAYLGQVARSAEQLGFEGALTPTGAWCEDAWLATAMLVPLSERLKFLVAFRPGMTSPTLAAQMAAHLPEPQRRPAPAQRRHRRRGARAARVRRLPRTRRSATSAATSSSAIVRALWAGETVDFDGEHLKVEGARARRRPGPGPGDLLRRVVAGGGHRRRTARGRLPDLGRAAAGRGREDRVDPGAGRRSRVARSGSASGCTRSPATPPPRRGPRRTGCSTGSTSATIARVQEGLRRSESEGQRRMLELNQGARDDLEIYPNLWAGVGLVRGGAGTALVGSHEEVADRIAGVPRARDRRVRPVRLPPPRGVLLVRRGRAADLLERRGLWKNPRPAAARVARLRALRVAS